jgi:hypothetical protein
MRALWVVVMVSIVAGLIAAGLSRTREPAQAARAGLLTSSISVLVLAVGVVWYYTVARVESRVRNQRIRQQRPDLAVAAATVSRGLSQLGDRASAPFVPRALSVGTGTGIIELWSGPTRSVHQVFRWSESEIALFASEGRNRVILHFTNGESVELRLLSDGFFTPRSLNADQSNAIVRAFNRKVRDG